MTDENRAPEQATADTKNRLKETAGSVTHKAATTNEGACSTGAPPLNMNGARHLLDSSPEIGRLRLAMGKLPSSLARCERAANAFRRALEEAVELAHGRIDLTAALAINTAARWERHSLLAMRWLREHGEQMDDAQRLAYSREIARASAERDKAVERLRLEPDDRLTIAATLYGAPTAEQ